jgi:hypothetical protein
MPTVAATRRETIVYILNDLAKATHDDKLRVAARHHLRGRAYAAHRAGNRRTLVPGLAFLRARRAAGAY